jgi:hypothetical protein
MRIGPRGVRSRAVAAALAVLVVTAAASVASGVASATSQATLQISSSPGLFPSFDPTVTDYVVRCVSGQPVRFSVSAPPGTKVTVDGGSTIKSSSTPTTVAINVSAGQEFSFMVNPPGNSSTTYYVRCLPSDFPTWTVSRPGTPQAQFYVVNPGANYVATFDNYGVPMWWYKTANTPVDSKLLPDGNMAWVTTIGSGGLTANTLGAEVGLNGSTVRTIQSTAGSIDFHEIQLLPNGDYLIGAFVPRTNVDLTAFGGSSNATIVDALIEELTPAGAAVWTWYASDHIALSETGPQWAFTFTGPAPDPFHFNSAEWDGSGIVLSFRHDNAVYKIDETMGSNAGSGNVLWKLSGTPRPESLVILGDPLLGTVGQHDARVLPDGTLTIHDNRSNTGGAPRAVRYSLDLVARTATLVETVTDPSVLTSPFTGSARKLPGGDWVMSWGGTNVVTELTSGTPGSIVFRLTLSNGGSYRAQPLTTGMVTRTALRAGMDAQYPRP